VSTDAEVVIVGGGVFGTSTAYHLARQGCRGVRLLEARTIGSQSSSQAAGFIRVLRASDLSTRMALYTIEMFERFREETGHDVGARQVGGALVALTEGTDRRLRQWVERAGRFGLESLYLTPAEARARFPLMRSDGFRSVVYEPRDLYLDPAEVPIGFVKAARAGGVHVQERTPVRGIEVEGGRVVAVRTDRERITTRWVVLTGGAWGPGLAARCGCRLVAVPVRHQLHITAPLPGVSPDFPMVRFPDLSIYVRPALGGLMVGGYEPNPASYDPAEMTEAVDVRRLEPNREALQAVTKAMLPFFPVLDGAPIAREQQGLPTLTPDGFPLVGEVPGMHGLLVASGDNVGGVSNSPAIGHILSDLIRTGRSPYDLAPMAVGRFGARYADLAALRRTVEARYANFGRGYLELNGKEG
jgi:glycine/D-amino acid oxidase-like deaminating enzyme